MELSKCVLICPRTSHEPIELPHGKTVTIGRNAETCITDRKVSRSQVELTANCESREVNVEATGTCPLEVDGKQLSKGEVTTARHRSSVCLLPGKFENIIQFVSGDKIMGKRSRQNDVTSHRAQDSSNGETKLKQTTLKFRKMNDTAVVPGRASGENENGSDSDSERQKEVAERLKILQANAKTAVKRDTASESNVTSSDSGAKAAKTTNAVLGKASPSSAWEEHGKLLKFTSKGVIASSKIASYDMDGTIITTQSGKVFPTSCNDWKILFPEVPAKLKALVSDGYKIVFFSNQQGFEKGRIKPQEFKTKVENIINTLGVPIQVYLSTGGGEYRKPSTGMWDHLIEQANDGIPVDVDASVFVGDAAGRPKDWIPGKKKDHSCGDRLFAYNVGISFHTPEEHFLCQKAAKFNMPGFDPRKLDVDAPLLVPNSAKLKSDKQEVIVLVGSPASGKSHFVRNHLIPSGYVQINRDLLGSWQKCVKATQDALEKGKSVAVDNTSPDAESRKRYVDVAKAAGIPCRCFLMATSPEHAQHNERFRELTDKNHQVISRMVFISYKSKYQEPKLAEGFQEIVTVNFIPKFVSSEQKALYQKFLVEN